jgi:hypothetical protein
MGHVKGHELCEGVNVTHMHKMAFHFPLVL